MSSTGSGSGDASVLSRLESLDGFPAESPIELFENTDVDKIKSALRGMETELVDLVLENACPSVWMDWLRLPLECATMTGSLDSVKRLLGAGVSWQASAHSGAPPGPLLHAAATSGNEGVIHELLKAGADVHAVDKIRSNRSALHVAAAEGAENAARALIGAGAEVDARDSRGWTPLHLACFCGHRGVVVFLLLQGADALARTLPHEDTPLHLAASRGHAGVISDLFAFGQACVSCSNAVRDTALHVGARAGHLQTCMVLLRAGASSSKLNAARGSPLDAAALNGHSGQVLHVLTAAESRADRQRRCSLALTYAARGNKPEAVLSLICLGADVNYRQVSGGLTCLHYSAMHGHYAAAEALLRAGADVEVRDPNSVTPLHQACMFSHVRLVELLLQWNADEFALSSTNTMPIDVIGLGAGTSESSGDEGDDRAYETIKTLLARAPADRVWRRRGWLVMCRARWLTRIKEARQSPSPALARLPRKKSQGRENTLNRYGFQTNSRKQETRSDMLGNDILSAMKRTQPTSTPQNTSFAETVKATRGCGRQVRDVCRDKGHNTSASKTKGRSVKKVLHATLRLGRESCLKDGSGGVEGLLQEPQGKNAALVGAVERLLLLREGGVFRHILTFL